MRRLGSFSARNAERALGRFMADRSGNFAMIFAIAAPVLMLGVGMTIDFSNTVSYQQRLQAAADSAALAAATAMVDGQSASAAQTIGLNYFQANVPGYGYVQNALNVYTGQANSTATATVSYSTTQSTLFGALTGSNSLPVVVQATATAYTGTGSSTNTNRTYAGTGGLWGDPHMAGADGSSYMFRGCFTTPATWYNALSDAGIEINFSCDFDAYWQEQAINDISIVIGSHVIATNVVQPVYAPDGTPNYNGVGWVGAVTIDGVTYNPPLGTTTYLNGLVTAVITDLASPANEDNYIGVNFTNGATTYAIVITYDAWEQAALWITATNAGMCGVPGGIWGNTLAGIDNTLSVYNYQVATPTSTTPQYSWATCAPQATLAKTAHLTQ